MYIDTYSWLCIHVRIHMYIYKYILKYIYVCSHTIAGGCNGLFRCSHGWYCVCVCVFLWGCVYVCVCIFLCACLCTCFSMPVSICVGVTRMQPYAHILTRTATHCNTLQHTATHHTTEHKCNELIKWQRVKQATIRYIQLLNSQPQTLNLNLLTHLKFNW